MSVPYRINPQGCILGKWFNVRTALPISLSPSNPIFCNEICSVISIDISTYALFLTGISKNSPLPLNFPWCPRWLPRTPPTGAFYPWNLSFKIIIKDPNPIPLPLEEEFASTPKEIVSPADAKFPPARGYKVVLFPFLIIEFLHQLSVDTLGNHATLCSTYEELVWRFPVRLLYVTLLTDEMERKVLIIQLSHLVLDPSYHITTASTFLLLLLHLCSETLWFRPSRRLRLMQTLVLTFQL